MSKECKRKQVTFKQVIHSLQTNRNYLRGCIAALIGFLIMMIGLVLTSISGFSICSYETQRPSWTRDVHLITIGGYLVAICLQLNRISLTTFREENGIGTKSAYFSSLIVLLISSIANLSIFFDVGGTCLDYFGVVSHAAIWPDWIITLPLLVFITISVDDKPLFSKEDLLATAILLVGTVFQTFVIITNSGIVAVGSLVLSTLLLSPVATIAYRSHVELEALLLKIRENPSRKSLYERKTLLASRRATMSNFLALSTPFFPVIYYLRLFGLVDENLAYVGFLLASAFMKIFFASLCMDAHLEVSHPAIAQIDAEKLSHTTRKAFLRFVFHEVRVPLNSISLGIQVLSNSPDLHKTEGETLSLMKEAATFMGETLNDVMALQTVEEGSMSLILKSFFISDLFQNIEDTFEDPALESDVTFKTFIDPDVPPAVIGDKYRLRHVLANLVSNGIKYSFAKGSVELRVSVKPLPADCLLEPTQADGEFAMLVFSVEDHGKGISKEDQEIDIFQPYRLLKHGELKKGRGTGLGLAICKEIVHLHGGEISYRSELGKGTTFFVHLPLEISKETRPVSWNVKRRLKSPGASLESHYRVLHHTSSSSTNPSALTHSDSISNEPEIESVESSASLHKGDSFFTTSFSNSAHNLHLLKKVDVIDEGIQTSSSLSQKYSSPAISQGEDNDKKMESDLQKSTETSFTSPVRPDLPPLQMDANSRLSPQLLSDLKLNPNNLRVLIVDDVLSNRKLLGMLLKQKGLKSINFAEDGVVAVKMIEQTLENGTSSKKHLVESSNTPPQSPPPDMEASSSTESYDIIFMDNTMPNLNGIAATEQIRSLGYKNLIIGVTGNSMQDELLDFVSKGADLVITKPMKPNLLDSLISLVNTEGSQSQDGKQLSFHDDHIHWEAKMSSSSLKQQEMSSSLKSPKNK